MSDKEIKQCEKKYCTLYEKKLIKIVKMITDKLFNSAKIDKLKKKRS